MIKRLFPKPDYVIEPVEPVEKVEEILEEVKQYFLKEGKDIEVIKSDKLPIVQVDNKEYIVRTDRFVGLMGGGRAIDEPYPVNYIGGQLGNIGGYKFVYLYEKLK
ncbi:MAG: hypothetical protein IKT45_09760 [Lachnospiraceae bacterium]|nr:hypothetical protein [Lachnospiraceae bacterium]